MKYEWDKTVTGDSVSPLWQEYSYRHEHIWKVVFQLTTAVVALSVVPYISGAERAGYLIVVPLLIASVLAFFSEKRIEKELKLFKTVKLAYLRKTRGDKYTQVNPTFESQTKKYLCALAWLSVFHGLIVVLALMVDDIYCLLNLGIKV